ncbi:MAG: sulfite exporter TauE/SafE family protein [Mycobacteriaceae bacterium]|uniref:sulfite exporter TauE/SafE family protein n=1 Tax=Corynebacterium sp. TaxID=1720 RepID=UPI003F9DCE91
MLTIALILVAAVFIGALIQRITGMGVGLIAGPILSVVLGPAAGVTVVNGLSTINAVNNAWAVRRETDWRRFAYLAGGLVLGSVPAVFVVMAIDGPWLLVTVGVLVLLALAVTMFRPDTSRLSEHSRLPMIIAGAAGGFMSTVAGIAAPAFTVYARLTGWDYKDFVSTLHPVIMVANTVSFLLKIIIFGGVDVGGLPVWVWLVAIAAIFVGAFFGDKLYNRISSEGTRKLATFLAFAGAVTLVVNGVVGMV